MKSFEDNKNEYMDELLSNEEVLMASVYNGMQSDNPKIIRAYQILLNPEDEYELEIAKALYSLADNFTRLAFAIDDEIVERIPVSENEGYKFIIDTMNKRCSKKEIEEYADSIDSKTLAKIVYDYTVGIGYEENADEYIASKANFNLSDPEELLDFKIRLEDACDTLEGITLLCEFNDNEVNKLKEFSSEINNIFKKGNVKKDNQKRLDF